MNNIRYHFLAFLVVAIWGCTFISTKVLIFADLMPSEIFFIRFVIAYIGILLFNLLGKREFRLWSDSLKEEFHLLLLGISGGSLYFYTENTALSYTQASNAAFLVCVAPLLTMLLTLVFKKLSKGTIASGLQNVRLSFPLVGGSFLALAGMSMVFFDGMSLQISPKGDLLAFAAALCWALYSLLAVFYVDKYGSLFVTRKVFIYGLLTIIPLLSFSGDSVLAVNPQVLLEPKVFLNLLFLGAVASLFCFIAWNRVMAALGNVTSTNYVYLNPVFTMIGAVLILGEKMTFVAALGCAMILAGVIFAGKQG